MELKELWSYIDAKRAVNKAQERLIEYEAVIYSPGGIRAAGVPVERSNDSPDRFAIIADNHEKLERELTKAQEKAARAYAMLLTFEKELSNEEVEVFFLRYVKNASVSEIMAVTHRCERTVKYINNKIKSKFQKFAPLCT